MVEIQWTDVPGIDESGLSELSGAFLDHEVFYRMSFALITGASRGIGRAVAIDLARHGFDVIVNYKSAEDAARETASAIEKLGKKAVLAQFDVADGPGVEAALEKLQSSCGTIEALVNNAGITRDGMFAMQSAESWGSVLDTNLTGFYNVTRPVVRQMLRQKRGRIVNITSISGERGNAGQVNYSASKAGLIGATKALALELAPRHITVNAVSPGFITTDMVADLPIEKIVSYIPMGRPGSPEEVAHAVSFLCSDRANYITGHVLSVNGGLYT